MNIDLIDCIPMTGGIVILAGVGYVLKGGLAEAMAHYGPLIVLAIPVGICLILLGAVTVVDYRKSPGTVKKPRRTVLGMNAENMNPDPVPTDGARSRDVGWWIVIGLAILGMVFWLAAGWWGW